MTKELTGYSNEISVFPGESIEFKISSRTSRQYKAELVRIIHGDMNPAGPGYKEEKVPSRIEGTYQGKYQPIYFGSWGYVPACRHFAALESFTLQAIIWPTTVEKGEQAIISLWDPASGSGAYLGINEVGELCLVIGDNGKVASVASGRPLLSREWYSVAASYDADSGTATLYQVPHQRFARVDDHASKTVQVSSAPVFNGKTSLSFAAMPRSLDESRHVARLFNGKIDRPRLSASALGLDEIRSREDPHVNRVRLHSAGLVGAWDFSRDIKTTTLRDCGPYQLHGETVNMPVRASKGANWTGEEMNWRHAPDEYGAIHFHDDSVYDAGWETDFVFDVPKDLKSGLYAARVQTEDNGDEDYVPFVVKADPASTRNKLVYLVPTVSYMAYANEHMPTDAALAQLLTDQVATLRPNDVFLNEHREYGASCYDTHSDGAGICYSSRLRPILNMRPKYRSWLGGTGSSLWQFNADTHITDWLEAKGYDFDFITEEDLHYRGVEALAPYTVLMTSSHSEYWSREMWDAADDFKKGGGRLISMGGNTWYWRVAFHETMPGVLEVRRNEGGIRAWASEPGEYYHSFTGEYGGLWRRQGRAPQAMCGTGFVAQGFDLSSYYVRTPDSFDDRAAFIFEGIGKDEKIGDFGLIGGGAAGLELDYADRNLGTPPNAMILAISEGHTNRYQVVLEEILINYPGTGGDESPLVRAELVFFETAYGGAVFSTSSIAWAGSLSHNRYDNNVSTIVANVVDRFLDDTPFEEPRA